MGSSGVGILFRGMTVQDFDLTRFVLGEEPIEVFPDVNALIYPALGATLNEVNSAMSMRPTALAKQCHINNARTAAHSFGQCVLVMGGAGMVVSDSRKTFEFRRFAAKTMEASQASQFFFLGH